MNNILSLNNIVLIITLIAGFITIIHFSAKHIRKFYIKSTTYHSIEPENIESIFSLSYLFLRLDQISQTGLWGRTLPKYIKLNYPYDKYFNKRLDHYRINGSITFTAYALEAIYRIFKTLDFYPSINYDKIENHIERKLLKKSGLLHPEPTDIVHVDESENLANELRHNSGALLTIYFLKKFSKDSVTRAKYNSWINSSLEFVFELPINKLWHCDPTYVSSLAIILHCFNTLSNDEDIYSRYGTNLDQHISEGVIRILERLENYYWLSARHNETKIFYTLSILRYLLKIPVFVNDPKKLKIAYDILYNLSNLFGQNKGISMGGLKDNSKFSYEDIGTSSRFLKIVSILLIHMKRTSNPKRSVIEDLIKWKKNISHFIRSYFLSLNYANYNATTHSFESVLLNINTFNNIDFKKIRTNLIRIDRIVDNFNIRNAIKKGGINLSSVVNSKFASQLIKRDMMRKPSRLKYIFGRNKYWW